MRRIRVENPSDKFDLQFPVHKEFDAVGVGMNTVDHLCIVPKYPEFDSKIEIVHYEKSPGGPTATAMTFLARMGLRAKYIGKIGSDDLGKLSLESLRSEALDISCVVSAPGVRNQYALIIVDQMSGERTVLWERDQKLDLADSEAKKVDVCSGRILHLDGVDHRAALRSATWARAEGIPVVIDLDKVVPNCDEIVSLVDFLITSSNFPSDFTGIPDPKDAMLELSSRYEAFVATTLGAKGAVGVVGDQCILFPGFKIEAKDTTGAGDVFHGAFIYGLLQNWSLERIMSFANAAAALNCTCLGARGGITSLPDILKLTDLRS